MECRVEKIISLKTILSFTPARAQNIVATASTNLAANPAQLTEMDFSELIWRIPDFNPNSEMERRRMRDGADGARRSRRFNIRMVWCVGTWLVDER